MERSSEEKIEEGVSINKDLLALGIVTRELGTIKQVSQFVYRQESSGRIFLPSLYSGKSNPTFIDPHLILSAD